MLNTDIINQVAFGKNHNLRDHMTGLELVLTMPGKEVTKENAIKTDAYVFAQSKRGRKIW